jgi:rod shape-determining protein MreD
MKWWAFFVLALVAVVLDTSFMPVAEIQEVAPRLMPALVVLVALYADRQTALAAAVVAGIIVDLNTTELFDGVRPYVLIGPTALGYMLGTSLVLPLRSMVVRRNPFAFGFLVAVFSLGAMLVTTFVFSLRGWYAGTTPPWMPEGRALGFMGLEALRALWSGAISVLIAVPLQRLTPALGFTGSAPWSQRRG